MENELSNTVTALGTYNSIPTSITSDAVLVTMISGLTITKSADKTVWADGALTYTIKIDNQAQETYAAPVVTDILNGSLVSFVTGSVTIDGVKAEDSEYSFDTGTNTLKVTLTDIAAGGSKTITFQVTKKA